MPIRHLLTLCDLTPERLRALLALAADVKREPSRRARALYEKTLLMIFEAPSLRTRLSFETAMTQLHGHAIAYYTTHSPWGVGKESIEDVARTVSRYCDVVTARIYSHDELVALAGSASVPVVNALTNEGHPCQVLADLLTIEEHVGRLEGLRVAYLGDARNNVTYSLARACAMTGNRLAIACPDDDEFRPEERILDEVGALGRRHGGRVDVFAEPAHALDGADVVYTDSWMSYRVPAEQKERRRRMLAAFRVTSDSFANAADGALFMHCLPAQRGDEVTAEVIDGPRSIVFDQAENRLHMEKAILLDLLGCA